MSKANELAQLIADAEACHKRCSDYSCVRSGTCTGFAGGALRDFYAAAKRSAEQAKSDAALAAQIKRLRKAGLV